MMTIMMIVTKVRMIMMTKIMMVIRMIVFSVLPPGDGQVECQFQSCSRKHVGM